MDINEKQAFLTNDWAHHSNFLDAVLCAMEKNLVNFTYVNYCFIKYFIKNVEIITPLFYIDYGIIIHQMTIFTVIIGMVRIFRFIRVLITTNTLKL
jgi:hypothetical protein